MDKILLKTLPQRQPNQWSYYLHLQSKIDQLDKIRRSSIWLVPAGRPQNGQIYCDWPVTDLSPFSWTFVIELGKSINEHWS